MIFIFLFLQLSGLAVIVVGAVIKLKYSAYIQVSSSGVITAPVFLIIIGAIIFIVGFLGCCGAWKENYCMVTTVSWKFINYLNIECVHTQFRFHLIL